MNNLSSSHRMVPIVLLSLCLVFGGVARTKKVKANVHGLRGGIIATLAEIVAAEKLHNAEWYLSCHVQGPRKKFGGIMLVEQRGGTVDGLIETSFRPHNRPLMPMARYTATTKTGEGIAGVVVHCPGSTLSGCVPYLSENVTPHRTEISHQHGVGDSDG